MPLSKLKLKEIAVSLPNGVLSNGLSESGVNEVNRIIDKVHGALFPKNASLELSQVENRLIDASRNVPLLADAIDAARGRQCVGSDAIPLLTIKKMIREHAGDVKVEDNLLLILCPILGSLVRNIMLASAEQIKDGVAVLDGKHVKAAMASGNLRDLSVLLSSVRSKRKSSSQKKSQKSKRKSSKKKSQSSRKRCSRGKSLVKGFVRDGKKVKSYCRKK